MMRTLCAVVLGAWCCWHDPGASAAEGDALAALPTLEPPRSGPLETIPGTEQQLGPGISIVPDHAVLLDGRLWIGDGPEEGLAIIACLTAGRLHESLVRLDTDNAVMVKAAFIAAFGWSDGATADPLHGFPPRGMPVRVTMSWSDDEGHRVGADASSLVRDRTTGRAFPAVPFIYTGSRMTNLTFRGTDGIPHQRTAFMLAEQQTVIAAFDEDDALLSAPLPGIADDIRFEVNTHLVPTERSRIRVICEPTVVPLTLEVSDDGSLTREPGSASLDDADLIQLLKARFAGNSSRMQRAVALHVAPASERQGDVRVCSRLLSAAATAGVWVIPIIVPQRH